MYSFLDLDKKINKTLYSYIRLPIANFLDKKEFKIRFCNFYKNVYKSSDPETLLSYKVDAELVKNSKNIAFNKRIDDTLIFSATGSLKGNNVSVTFDFILKNKEKGIEKLIGTHKYDLNL